jgi:hypothetical protein
MAEPATPAPGGDRSTLLADALLRLDGALGAIRGGALRREDGRPADRSGWVDLTAFDLGAPCPARFASPVEDNYVETAPNAARRLGRLTLRRWRPGVAIGPAVASVLSERDDWAPGLREWFESLDRPGRAAVAAATTTWAVGALTVTGGRTGGGGRRLTWSERNEPIDVPGWSVRLRGSWDALTGTRSAPHALLVLRRGAPGPADALESGFQALACGIGPRTVPGRVAIAHAGSAAPRSVPVTAAVLAAAVDRIAELAAYRLDPEAAPTVSGRWCAHCHLAPDCPDAPVDVLVGGPVAPG